ELESAVAHLEHGAPHPLKGFIIDLRNNPGGVLDSAIRVADDFLNSGTIVSARGRTDEANFRVNAAPGDITHGAQLVVVVNGGSASAAEVLAAALHDNGRAHLIGRRTYGKGTVQTIMPMAYGTALKITTSRYYTPAGICINGVGIVPDVVLKGPEQSPADLDDPADAPRPLSASRAASPVGGASSTQVLPLTAGLPSTLAVDAPMPAAPAAAPSSTLTPARATAAGGAVETTGTLAQRDPQVGVALSLLQNARQTGVSSSVRSRVIGRADGGALVR